MFRHVGGLPPTERLRFLRHLRPFRDVHRYQSAPQIAEAVAGAIAEDRLEVLAASLRAIETEEGGLIARLHPRRAAENAMIERRVGAVVACVGPGHVSAVDSSTLLRSLSDAGALRADLCGLGIEIDSQARCIGEDDRPVANLFVAGPMARGMDGELMGLPQVSLQPRAVAARVAALLYG